MATIETTDAIENPVTGERVDVREHTPDALRFDYRLTPGGFAAGQLDHVHPRQVEQVRVRSGRLGVRVGGEEWIATAGEQFTVPASEPHTLWNPGEEPVRTTVELRPALETTGFFRTIHGLARDGRTNEWGMPGILQLAVLLDAYADEFVFAGLPRSVQLGAAALLAPLGRLVGRRARYSRYEPEPSVSTGPGGRRHEP